MTRTLPAGIHVREFGQPVGAPTLLLIHGRSEDGSVWPDAVRRWADTYRMIAPDMRGHGESDRFTADELAGDPMRQMYEDCVAILAYASADSAEPVVVVGHSMGAGLASDLAAWEPRYLRAAVLEEPTWYPTINWDERREHAQEMIASAAIARTDIQNVISEYQVNNPHWPDGEAEQSAYAKSRMDDAFIATAKGFVNEPWEDIASAISIPTLMVSGTTGNFQQPSWDAIENLHNPNIAIEVLDGASHSVRRDMSEQYHAVVDPWIAQQFTK